MALTDAVPTRLVWRGGGTNVFVTGDFCSWRPDMCRMMLEKRSGAQIQIQTNTNLRTVCSHFTHLIIYVVNKFWVEWVALGPDDGVTGCAPQKSRYHCLRRP